MIRIIILIIFSYQFLSATSLTDEEIEERTISFCDKLIENPDSLLSILQNEKIINTEFILNQEYLSMTIEYNSLIIKAHKRNRFTLSEFIIQPADSYSEKLAVLEYRKHDNFFYNIYSYFKYTFFGGGCSNYISYYFNIIDDEIYFRSIGICQHMHPSELDE